MQGDHDSTVHAFAAVVLCVCPGIVFNEII